MTFKMRSAPEKPERDRTKEYLDLESCKSLKGILSKVQKLKMEPEDIEYDWFEFGTKTEAKGAL